MVHDTGLLERLASKIERAMSATACVTLPDASPVLASVGPFAMAAGLFLWRKLRKIEVRLDHLRGEVNRLNLIEARRFLVALSSGANPGAEIERAEPSNSSIVPDIADIHSEHTPLAVADSADISR